MKPKTMILMGLAIACGLGASYMTSRLLADRGEPEAKEMVEIVVAKKALSVGQHIAKPDDFFEKKPVPKEDVPGEAIRDMDALKGKILKMGRNKGEAITPANVFGDREQVPIPAGHRAIGLRVNIETSAFGLATLPQSRVDIIYVDRAQTLAKSSATVLLQNVLVLAADGKIERDGVTAVAQVVTLALTPEDALRLTLAKDTGLINLLLRNLDDPKTAEVTSISGKNLLKKGSISDDPPITETPKVIVEAPKQKIEPVQPIVEELRGTPIRLDIFNGQRHSWYTARLDDDNRVIEEESTAPTPAPAPGQRQLPRRNIPDDN